MQNLAWNIWTLYIVSISSHYAKKQQQQQKLQLHNIINEHISF